MRTFFLTVANEDPAFVMNSFVGCSALGESEEVEKRKLLFTALAPEI